MCYEQHWAGYLHTHHKEQCEDQMKADQTDRLSLHNALDVHIYPLDYVSQPDGALINIVTWQIADPDGKASCHNGCEQKACVSR